MAAGDPYVGCSNPHIGWLELLNSVLTKNDDGTVGLRIYQQDVATASLNDFIACGDPLKDFETVLRHVICLDACDKPAIRMITCTP